MPRTMDEAIDYVLARLSDEDKGQLRETPREGLSELHFGLGMWIRNKLRLWDRESGLSEPIDELRMLPADMVSMDIIKGVWGKLQQSESKGEG